MIMIGDLIAVVGLIAFAFFSVWIAAKSLDV